MTTDNHNTANRPYRLIGLTGPTGSGKSVVGRVFADYGFAVVDADRVAHTAIESEEYKQGLVREFSDVILNPDGTVNRRKVAEIAFSTKENTAKLNAVAHPVIIDFALRDFEGLSKAGYKNIVFDAPTLIESGSHTLCDVVVSVIAPLELRRARIISRDNLTEEEADRRISAQHHPEFYTDKSHYIIINDSDTATLRERTENIIKELL